jgi:type VI secretion system protein ImpK
MATADSDDPLGPRDATVIRPRAGGRRLHADGGRLPSPVLTDSGHIPALDLETPGLNPLVQAATPLLLMAGQLRLTPSLGDVAGLRRHALDEIRRFEEKAAASGVASEVILAARYALCATLDEAALSTPWGAQSEWAQNSLLVALHREAWGGQKFFDMLARIMPDPARHIELLELQYLCLAVGFAGKYHVAERGHAQLAEVEREVHRTIRNYRGAPPPDLSPRWRGREDRRNPLLRYVPWWVVGAGAAAVLLLTFLAYYTWIAMRASPIHAALAGVGVESFVDGPVAPPRGPTLKQLLQPEEAKGLLSVEEDGGRTTVTLAAFDLFASGSERVTSAVVPTLDRVAAAIRQVPGRVLVTGHTDDQPIRSFRFPDNYALSRARAESVAEILERGVDASGRIQSTGVGSTQPRYRPESAPENRTRNRRVEIVHVAES